MKKNAQEIISKSFLPTLPAYSPSHPAYSVIPAKYIEAQKTAQRTDWIRLEWTGSPALFPVAPLRDWMKIIAKQDTPATMEWDTTCQCLWVHDNDPVTPGKALFKAYNPGPEPLNRQSDIVIDEETGAEYFTAPRGFKDGFILTLTTEPVKAPAQADPWLAKAASKDTARPQLQKVYGNMGTDGYRLHYDPALPAPAEPAPMKWEYILEDCRKYQNIATVSKKELMAACKAAKKCTAIDITLNGLMVYSYTNDDATMSGEITAGYSHTGPDLTMRISPAHLIDAMSGFDGDTVLIAGKDGAPSRVAGLSASYPAYFTDGSREAAIMTVMAQE